MTAPGASWSDLYAAGRAEYALRRPDLVIIDGTIADVELAAAAAMADKNEQTAAALFKRLFLDGAEKDDLTKLVDSNYGIQRNAAVKATVSCTMSRAAFTAGAGSIPAGTLVGTVVDALGKVVRFTTNALVSFGATELGPKTIACTAETAGVAGNVAAAKVTRIIDTIFDATITITNATNAAGGAEAESDESLRARAQILPQAVRRDPNTGVTFSNGGVASLEFGSRRVSGVANATASEAASGITTVYVTDASGNSTGTVKTVGPSLLDDGTMTAKVAIELMNWKAPGALVEVQGGALFTQDVTVSLTVKVGTDVAAIAGLVQAAVTARLAQLKIGETLYRSMVRTAVMNVAPDRILEVTVTLPGADVAPAGNQVIRAGVVTVS